MKESSTVLSIAYLPEEKKLTISFRSGHTYQYLGVEEELFMRLNSAPSKGKFIHNYIKGKFPHIKI